MAEPSHRHTRPSCSDALVPSTMARGGSKGSKGKKIKLQNGPTDWLAVCARKAKPRRWWAQNNPFLVAEAHLLLHTGMPGAGWRAEPSNPNAVFPRLGAANGESPHLRKPNGTLSVPSVPGLQALLQRELATWWSSPLLAKPPLSPQHQRVPEPRCPDPAGRHLFNNGLRPSGLRWGWESELEFAPFGVFCHQGRLGNKASTKRPDQRFAKPHWSGRFSGRAAIVPGVELRPPPRRRTSVRDETGRATGWTPVPAAPRPRKAQERRDASLRTPRSRPASRARRHAGPALLRARGPGRGEASAGPRDAAARPSARRRWRSRAGGRSRPGAAASSRRPPSSRRLPAAVRGARSGSGRSPNRSMAEAPLHTLKAPAPSVTAAQALTSRL
jgi:hypothetical protein